MDIIHQSKEVNCREIMRLSGPTCYYFYVSVLGRRILLLGDRHYNRSLCPSLIDSYEVHQWLYQLSFMAPQCLDLFVEQSYLKEPPTPSPRSPLKPHQRPLIAFNSPLEAIRETFHECYQVNKQQCHKQFHQLRYHYVDLRQMIGGGSPLIVNWILQHRKIFRYYNPKFNDLRSTIYHYLLTLDQSKRAREYYLSYIHDIYAAFPEIRSDNLPFDLFSNDAYLYRYFILIRKELRKLDPLINQQQFLLTLCQVYMDDPPEYLMRHLLCIHQDVYLLLRLFMVYDPKKIISRGPLGCRYDDYHQNKNIIVYTGSLHTQYYKRFLWKMFQIQPTLFQNPSEDDYQCLEFEQPFDFFQNPHASRNESIV